MTQYRQIAIQYTDKSRMEHPERKNMIYPSWLQACGNVREKTILDLGCGGGESSRLLADKGATVIGGDKELKMLKLARQTERKNPLNINYLWLNAGWPIFVFRSVLKFKRFDLITAAFLLHYAKNKKSLRKMATNIYSSLNPGGKIVAINTYISAKHYLLHPQIGERSFSMQFVEGAKILINFKINEIEFNFSNTFWKPETYERILMQAGFKEINWIRMKMDREGRGRVKNYKLLENMPLAVLTAEK